MPHACVKTPFGLTDIAVASSYSPGAVTDTLPDVDSAQLTRPLLYRENASLRELPSAVLADGGVVDNLGIIPLVQRGVRTILCLANEQASLEFEPDNPPYCNIDYSILALFGRPIPSDVPFGQYLRYENAHIFEEDDISVMVNAMKESLSTNDGILCSFQVRTVRNDFYKIQAGTQHTIVLFYPSVPKKLARLAYGRLCPWYSHGKASALRRDRRRQRVQGRIEPDCEYGGLDDGKTSGRHNVGARSLGSGVAAGLGEIKYSHKHIDEDNLRDREQCNRRHVCVCNTRLLGEDGVICIPSGISAERSTSRARPMSWRFFISCLFI